MVAHRSYYEQKVYDLSDLPTEAPVKKLLLLEDDREFASLLQVFLESIGYLVTVVPDGVAGLKQILGSDFDIILCDLLMPNLPGDLFYVAVERTKPHLCKRFVFMTGHKANPKWDAFIRKIRGCVLWKPFQMHELQTALNSVLQKAQLPEDHQQ